MVEWSDELLENMKRFRDETGMTYEQMKKAGDDAPPYDDWHLKLLAEENLTPEENREALLRDTMEELTTDASLNAVKTLQERVGFTTLQLTEILKESFHDVGDLLTTMTDLNRLTEMEFSVKLGNVSTDKIVEEFRGARGEDKVDIADCETFPNMMSDAFPDADWDKYYDDELYKRSLDDLELLEALGEPKQQGFADKVRKGQSDEKSR